MRNPIKASSRSFQSILNDINSVPELADKPNWFKMLIAGIGDVNDIYVNMESNQSYLETAFTRDRVTKLLRLIDYQLKPYSTASGKLLFDLSPDTILPHNVNFRNLVGLTDDGRRYESRSSIIHSAWVSSFFSVDGDELVVAKKFVTGALIQLSSTEDLPEPLEEDTDYFVIYVSDTKIKVASSRERAFAGIYIPITTAGSGDFVVTQYSIEVECFQQSLLDVFKPLGLSSNLPWQIYDLPDRFVLKETLELKIGIDFWTRTDDWINSEATDKHFKLLYFDNGLCKVQFGDGIYGEIPNGEIEVMYATGGGVNSNISHFNRINVYGGGDDEITGVTNHVFFTGGADEEDIEVAKQNAPILLKSRDRFITTEDGKILAESFAGVITAKVNRNIYGLLSCQVVIVPNGGGFASDTIKNNLRNYLINRSILESIDVRIDDPQYIDVSFITQVKILSGFAFETVKSYVVLAMRLFVSEVTKEIYTLYRRDGAIVAINFLNDKWGTNFSGADVNQISLLLEEINLKWADFGKDIQYSSLISYIMNVAGIEHINVSSPTFPILVSDEEITTDDINPSNITEI